MSFASFPATHSSHTSGRGTTLPGGSASAYEPAVTLRSLVGSRRAQCPTCARVGKTLYLLCRLLCHRRHDCRLSRRLLVLPSPRPSPCDPPPRR